MEQSPPPVVRFGRISCYDFLYNINDRGGRSPRGYAFVTFETPEGAAAAIQGLHKKKVLTRVRQGIHTDPS